MNEIHEAYERMLDQSVERGLERLREHNVRFEEVDLSTLDISSPERCMGGQCFTDYRTGMDEMGIEFDKEPEFGFEPIHYGSAMGNFGSPVYPRRAAYEFLTRRWTQVVLEERARIAIEELQRTEELVPQPA